ncbi:putative spermidine synthase [Cooperia oncophora]
MDFLHKGWFTEFSPDDLERMKQEGSSESKQLKSDGEVMGGAWPGQAFSLKSKRNPLPRKKRIPRCSSVRENEMSSHIKKCSLTCRCLPIQIRKRLLIIGGGDGGILREVLKHPEVEHVTMCEIDRVVIEASKRFLPGMSCCFSDPKLNLFCGDGFEFLKNHKNEFDVIITDSSDPVGPAESLFGKSYYELLRDSLNENGVLSSQGECPWLDLALIAKVLREYCTPIFPVARYAVGSVPTYTSGFMGYIVCSKAEVLIPFS